MATDVIGTNDMMNQTVPSMVTMVEIWGLQMIIVATALEHAWTPPTGLIKMATDVIGTKKIMHQAVPRMVTMVEIWELQMIIVATALEQHLLFE
jgi:hypothetical protein